MSMNCLFVPYNTHCLVGDRHLGFLGLCARWGIVVTLRKGLCVRLHLFVCDQKKNVPLTHLPVRYLREYIVCES